MWNSMAINLIAYLLAPFARFVRNYSAKTSAQIISQNHSIYCHVIFVMCDLYIYILFRVKYIVILLFISV